MGARGEGAVKLVDHGALRGPPRRAPRGLVRKCADASRVLFFHDVSKNHTRQWCSMGSCGNCYEVSAFRSRTGR